MKYTSLQKSWLMNARLHSGINPTNAARLPTLPTQCRLQQSNHLFVAPPRCPGVVISTAPSSGAASVAPYTRQATNFLRATGYDTTLPAIAGERSSLGQLQQRNSHLQGLKSGLGLQPIPPLARGQQRLPPPEPSQPPLYSYLHSLLVEPFDILMRRPSDSVDYMSADMRVRAFLFHATSRLM